MVNNKITGGVIGTAEFHQPLGPELLEFAYETCMCFELREWGLEAERRLPGRESLISN